MQFVAECPLDQLRRNFEQLWKSSRGWEPGDPCSAGFSRLTQEGIVIADDLERRRCVFLAGLYRAEREIAEKLKALAAGKPPWPLIDADKAIPWVEKRTKLALEFRLYNLSPK